jgi:hypothetical protein
VLPQLFLGEPIRILHGGAKESDFTGLGKGVAMLPMIPAESMAGAFEFMCYFFTALGALISFATTLRF